MILIAESGSTKCDWLLYDMEGKPIDNFSSMGFNPYFHDQGFILSKLNEHPKLADIKLLIKEVYFFGAGVSSVSLVQVVRQALDGFFAHAVIEVDHDLTASAYATYNGSPGISCIIGTGSNSVYFDGESLREEVPSLAFILGDEGSGSFHGKKLLTAYFYKQLPTELHEDFIADYPNLDKDKFTKEVYQSNHANVFLASFMPFIIKHKDHMLIQSWIQEGFELFTKYQVLCFPEAHDVPIHFVGSIAQLLQPELNAVLEANKCTLGTIIAKPATHLADYIFKYLRKKRGL